MSNGFSETYAAVAIRPLVHMRDERIIIGLVVTLFVSVYLTVAAIVAIAMYLLWQGRLRPILESVRGAYVLQAFCAVTLIVSLLNANANGVMIALFMSVFFIVAVYIRHVMSRSFFEQIVEYACLASLLGVFVGIYQFLAKGMGLSARIGATFLNANLFATISMMVVLLCLYKLLQPGGRRHPMRHMSILLLNLFGLYISDCRTAVVALSVSILVMLWLNRRYRALVVALFVGILLVALVLLHPGVMPRLGESGSDVMGRVSIWVAALKGIALHPLFGQGPQTYELIYAQFGGVATVHAHSLYLDPILNFGLVGMTMLLYYLSLNLHPIRLMRSDPQDRYRFNLLAAVLTGVAIHGVMDITVFNIQTGLLLFMVLSVAGIQEKVSVPIRATIPVRAHNR